MIDEANTTSGVLVAFPEYCQFASRRWSQTHSSAEQVMNAQLSRSRSRRPMAVEAKICAIIQINNALAIVLC